MYVERTIQKPLLLFDWFNLVQFIVCGIILNFMTNMCLENVECVVYLKIHLFLLSAVCTDFGKYAE